jgi:hypothetical protein
MILRFPINNEGAHVARFLKEDSRPLPKPTEQLELDPQTRLIVQTGGIIFFRSTDALERAQ